MAQSIPFWIIEKETFPDEETNRLKGCLDKMGVAHVEVEGNLAGKLYIDQEITWGDDKYRMRPSVFYGSLGLARWVQEHSLLGDSVVCNFEALRCMSYYPSYTTSLLNEHYLILPLSEAIRNKGLLFDTFGMHDGKSDPKIFVRPDGAAKEFSGRVLTEKQFTLRGLDHGIYYDSEEILVLVAPAQNILNEYRIFVTYDNEILMGTAMPGNKESDIPNEAYEFIKTSVFKVGLSHPDPIYVIDVVETELEGYKVVELNSASCSGLYGAAPLEPFVARMNQVVAQRYKETHG